MRQVDVGEEDVRPLRELAIKEGRTFREQGRHYLHLIVSAEYAKWLQAEPDRASEAVA